MCVGLVWAVQPNIMIERGGERERESQSSVSHADEPEDGGDDSKDDDDAADWF